MRVSIAGGVLVAVLAAGHVATVRSAPADQRPQPQTGQQMTPDQARAAIMAAEDRRLPLPDDLHTPAIDTLRGLQAEDLRLLIQLARSSRYGWIRSDAIRALGRYERRELTPELLQLLALELRSADSTNAVAQSLRGPALALDVSGEQIEGLLHPTRFVVDLGSDVFPLGAFSRSIGRLPYTSANQVQAADEFFVGVIERLNRDRNRRPLLVDVARAVESRARLHARLGPLSDDLIVWMRRMVTGFLFTYAIPARVSAMTALIASRGVDAETLRAAAVDGDAPEIRRLAALSMGSAGSPVAPTERTDTLINLLADSSVIVRIEAVRAWSRQETRVNGCPRLLDALRDPSLPVVLVVLDALGDQCPADVNVTDRLAVEARATSPLEWHRPSHALVSLARRAPDRVAILMPGHVTSVVWQARMYAARAAAITNDVVTLERLAVDPVDNVREAALPPLRRLKKAEADVQFVAALGRTDYQLLRTASLELKGAMATPELAGALGDALRRVTFDKRETSRDVRLELLERLRELGSEDQSGPVAALLQDFDIEVARSAAATLQLWTGRAQEIGPVPLPRPPLPMAGESAEAGILTGHIRLGNGKTVRLHLLLAQAPLASVRFLRLAKAGYYNGLTFHRVVPNFIIQGGSPGANEYAGDGPYLRDEISLAANTRGTVGLSTRGRDTGDAQFYINLVDNPRLDFEYTVFGRIDPRDMPAVDAIVEGDEISSISFEKPADEKHVRQSNDGG